jgi:hypothetical protein
MPRSLIPALITVIACTIALAILYLSVRDVFVQIATVFTRG